MTIIPRGSARVPINNLCVVSSNAPSPFRWLLTGHVDITSRFFRIHNLNFACSETKTKQGIAGLVQQKFRRVRLHFDVGQDAIVLASIIPTSPLSLPASLPPYPT